MKLLIDIPEHIYEHAKETTEDSRDEFDAMRAIANGTQQESRSEIPNKSEIPTSCGDAISRQAVLDILSDKPAFTDTISSMESIFDVKHLPSVMPKQRTGHMEVEE